MIRKLISAAFLGLWIFSADCFSQDYESLCSKAKFYYESDEYQLAIPYFTNCINQNPDQYETYILRGNCYLEVGQTAKAIQDYLFALRMKKNSDVIYKLGNAYERANDADSAIYYFRKFIDFEPNISDGHIRLCILYMYSRPEYVDSAIYFASRAVNIESENPTNLNFLALAYYSGDQFKSALETCLLGLAIDSSFSALNQTAGICSFFLKDYPSAISYFDRAYKSNPADFTLLDYKIQAMLLRNTNPDAILFQSGKRISFKEISSENIKNIEANSTDSNGKYFYKKLIQKLRSSPQKMSLDEFFMLYIGYSLQTGYAPFVKTEAEKTKENDLVAEAGVLEDILNKNPTDFPVYLSLADIYQQMGNEEKYFENRFKYFGFIESIKAAGNGLSTSTAYIVNDISHEYSIMLNIGFRIKAHSRIKEKNHYFDVLTGTDQNNKDIEIFFNIDKPFRTLPKKGRN
jgi:tetratricopeptide (TPR) repeat protein